MFLDQQKKDNDQFIQKLMIEQSRNAVKIKAQGNLEWQVKKVDE